MTDNALSIADAQFYSELLRAYFDSANDAIFVLCDEMKFLTCNKMTERWLGCSEGILTEHKKRTPVTQLLGKDYNAAIFSSSFRKALTGKTVSFETLIYPEQGDRRWVEINLTKVDIENGDMVIAIARDISERKKHLAAIDYQTHYDSLTGLPNRTSLNKYLHEQKSALVLFTICLERFQEINESLGQQQGDNILIEISQRLQRITDNSAGEYIARFGGVKFALAIPGLELSQAEAMAQTIRQIILHPISTAEGKISLDCGIGIASTPVHSASNSELLHFSQAAMRIARSEKMGVNIYHPDAVQTSTERLQMVADLRAAIETGVIRPYYQPIVNMHNGTIHVEALARWPHPVQGYINPDAFINVAEESSMINPLTSNILHTAMAEVSELINSGMIDSLSVNLSPNCLSNTKLPGEIELALNKYRINASALTLELTESFVMSSISRMQKTLNLLHELGLGFSIDDFGTGYSSLAKLTQMTLKELKIDKSFILDITTNEDDAAITFASIQMAHALGLSVVAEGIENEATWLRLKQMGCDFGQGFWIARPMPYDELVQWLSNH